MLLGDATRAELVVWAPIVVFVIVLGLWPAWLLDATEPAVRQVLGG